MSKRLKENGYVFDLTGKVFDKLTVIGFKEVLKLNNNSVALWHCVCSCGNKVDKRATYLSNKSSFSSCGCVNTKGEDKKKLSLLWGFGINDIQSPTQREEKCPNTGKRKVVWRCPYYQKWMSMIRRCYSKVLHEKTSPAYIGCYVSDDWKYFSNFKRWMEKQDWEGKELDKDLLDYKNKCYSEENCLFISPEVNVFMTSTRKNRGEYPLGVHLSGKKYCSQCHNPLINKQEQLGNYNTPEEAHEIWKIAKLEGAKYLAGLPENEDIGQLLVDRYTFKGGEICPY